MALLTAPICILKQAVSVIQLGTACYNVSLIDEDERAKNTNWLGVAQGVNDKLVGTL